MKVDEQAGRELARYARACIAEALGGDAAATPSSLSTISQKAGTFVTLRRGETLHGCIGALTPRGTILDDVKRNAVAAALLDPRAPRLSLEGVPGLDVEVSLLSDLDPIEYDGTEEGARRALVPFRDGVVLRCGRAQGTFLPQVWESLPRAEDFLRRLKEKAGLGASPWSPEIKLFRYSSRKWVDRAAMLA